MSQQDERTKMARSLRRGEEYGRRVGSWGSISYYLGDAGNGGNLAIWQVRGGSSAYPSDTFEAIREKVCSGPEEAVQYLQDHFDDPMSVAEVARTFYE